MADVHTGRTGRQQHADHGGVHAGQHVAHARPPAQSVPERHRAGQQQGARQEDHRQHAETADPAHPAAGGCCAATPKTRQRRKGPRHGLRRAIARQEIRLRHHAAGHRRIPAWATPHARHRNQRAGPVEACELRGQGRGGVFRPGPASRSTGPRTVPAAPIPRRAARLRRLSEQGRGGSCSTAAPTTAPRAMAASCPGAEGKARVISAATQAMPARIRSGQSVCGPCPTPLAR